MASQQQHMLSLPLAMLWVWGTSGSLPFLSWAITGVWQLAERESSIFGTYLSLLLCAERSSGGVKES